MKYNTDSQDKFTLLQLEEDKLNSVCAPDLKATILTAHNEGPRNIILDLSKVNYCDSSGLSAILMANRLCRDNNGTFVLSNLQPAVEKVISISQLEKVLHITPTVAEAADLVYMEEVERELNN